MNYFIFFQDQHDVMKCMMDKQIYLSILINIRAYTLCPNTVLIASLSIML